MQILSNIQKELAKIVVFNRVFSASMFVCLALYLMQLSSETNLITIVILVFGFVILLFHVLLIEIIGQIIRKKTILTHDICDWIAKVIVISSTVVITVACLTTGNIHFASYYAVPIIICSLLKDTRARNIGIFAGIFLLIFYYSGFSANEILINNTVTYLPSALIQVSTLICLVVLSIIILHNTKQTSQKNNVLQSMATTDMLTGLINRRHFDRRMAEEVSRCKRHNSNLSLAMFDIDYFKLINDTYGHTIGDRILKELGDVILKNTRESDISARYGGEEFALILPETTQIEAFELLERLRQLIENHTFMKDESPVLITISVGIAQFDPETTADDFIQQVDAALYQAKRSGRNKVVYGTFTTPRLNLQKKTCLTEF